MASKQLLEIGTDKQSSLKRYNLIAGIFHAVQAIAILILSNGFSFPVHINYLQGPPIPGTKFEQVAVFDFPVALGVASFSILSALAHFYVSGPGFTKYIDGLRNKRNYFRWIEYSISSTLMILLISMLNSIWDVVALMGIAAANISMILFGCYKRSMKNQEQALYCHSGLAASQASFLGLPCSGYWYPLEALPTQPLRPLSTAS